MTTDLGFFVCLFVSFFAEFGLCAMICHVINDANISKRDQQNTIVDFEVLFC